MDPASLIAKDPAINVKNTVMEQSDETANCNDGRQKLHAQQAHLKDMRERLLLYKKRHEAVLRDEEKREKEEAEQNRRVEEERQRLEEERQSLLQGSQLPEKRQLTHSADNTMLANMFGFSQSSLAAQLFSGNSFGMVTEREAIDWLRADAHKQ